MNKDKLVSFLESQKRTIERTGFDNDFTKGVLVAYQEILNRLQNNEFE